MGTVDMSPASFLLQHPSLEASRMSSACPTPAGSVKGTPVNSNKGTPLNSPLMNSAALMAPEDLAPAAAAMSLIRATASPVMPTASPLMNATASTWRSWLTGMFQRS